MKIKALILISFLFISCSINAQESSEKEKEVGLTFYNFNNYGLTYKVGKENKMWRFRAFNGGLDINSEALSNSTYPTGYPSTTYLGYLSFSIGRERRKEIKPKINLVYGLDILINYTYEQTNDIEHYIGGGIVGVLGMRYEINQHFFVGAELLPSITYNAFAYTQKNDLSINFGNGNALLSVGLKF